MFQGWIDYIKVDLDNDQEICYSWTAFEETVLDFGNYSW